MRADLAARPWREFWGDGTALPEAKGRGGAALISIGGVAGVLRDYRRGGRLGFLGRRSYLDPHRPERELRVLAALDAAGVPVVRPLAALARRRWLLFHRLRLITAYVEAAVPLPAFIASYPAARRQAVAEAGRVTAAAFAAGLHHRDLHPDNMIARVRRDGAVQVILLDLDRATLEPSLSEERRDGMLVRMARYLRRHKGTLPVQPSRVDTVRFLAGAGWDRPARRAMIRRVQPLYERALQRRGLA